MAKKKKAPEQEPAPPKKNTAPPPAEADEEPAVPEALPTERPNAVRWLAENKTEDVTIVGDVSRFLAENFDDFPKSSAAMEIQSAMGERGAPEAVIAGVIEAIGAYTVDRQESASQ